MAYAKVFGGAAAGATVGTMIVPVVGTVVGGAIGLMAGSASRGGQQKQFASSAMAMATARDSLLPGTRSWRLSHSCGSFLRTPLTF